MCCCHEHKNDDCGCGCMRIYHLMDDGGECTDKAILCRLDDMKKDECGKKQDDCGCEKKHDDCGHGHGKPDGGCGCHKPERPEKPDCAKPDNPEIRCGVETGWKPETGWCYPYAK